MLCFKGQINNIGFYNSVFVVFLWMDVQEGSFNDNQTADISNLKLRCSKTVGGHVTSRQVNTRLRQEAWGKETGRVS